MTACSPTRNRVSPRQAIIVVYSDSTRAPIQRAMEPLLLDLLGTLVGVNGVSIVVVATNRTLGREIAKALPAGVELFVPPSGEPAVGWTASKLIAKGFERILVVACDVVGLPVRVISTALSAIESESVIRADTPHGNPFMFGVSTLVRSHTTALVQLNSLDHCEPFEQVASTRGMDRFTRLSELADVSEIRKVVNANSRLMPRLSKEIERLGFETQSEFAAQDGHHG